MKTWWPFLGPFPFFRRRVCQLGIEFNSVVLMSLLYLFMWICNCMLITMLWILEYSETRPKGFGSKQTIPESHHFKHFFWVIFTHIATEEKRSFSTFSIWNILCCWSKYTVQLSQYLRENNILHYVYVKLAYKLIFCLLPLATLCVDKCAANG